MREYTDPPVIHSTGGSLSSKHLGDTGAERPVALTTPVNVLLSRLRCHLLPMALLDHFERGQLHHSVNVSAADGQADGRSDSDLDGFRATHALESSQVRL